MYVSDEAMSGRDPGSDLVPRQRTPVVVPVESSRAAPMLFQDQPTQDTSQPKVSPLAILRFKWMMLGIFVLIAGPAVAGIWTLIVPMYGARAEVRVRPIIPRLVFRTDENGMIPFYSGFMNTQVAIIRSRAVLQRVLEQEDVRKTQWYSAKQGPLAYRQPLPPMERLQDGLSAGPRRGTEIIDISMTARRGLDSEVIANAVLDQYLKFVREVSDETEDLLYRQLTEQYKALENEIAGREAVIARLRKELGTGNPAELVARKRVRVDQTEAELRAIWQRLSVLELRKRRLERDHLVSEASEQELDRLRFIRAVTEMPLAARREFQRRLHAEREALAGRIAEYEKVVSELRPTPKPNAGDVTLGPESVASQPSTELITRPRASAASQPGAPVHGEAVRFHALMARLEVLQRQVNTIDWQAEELAKLVSAPETEPVVQATQPVRTPEFHEDPEWRRLDLTLKSLQHKWRTESQYLKPTHPKMIDLAGELKFATELIHLRETQLAQEQVRPRRPMSVAGMENVGAIPRAPRPDQVQKQTPDYRAQLMAFGAELEVLRHQEQLVQAELKAQKDDFGRTFNSAQMLDRESKAVQHKREIFQAVRTRLDQKETERNVPGSIEVLNRAFAPSKPSQNRRLVFTIMALAAGMGAAVMVGYLRAAFSQDMHSTEDLPALLRTPFLGQLPVVDGAAETPNDKVEPVLAEGARMIRTALLARLRQADAEGGGALLITSAEPGAGKSTLTALLAHSLAECGKRVLMVDADMRTCELSSRLGLRDEPGLTECLANGDRITIYPTNMPNLSFIPAGQRHSGAAIELTANGVFSASLADWRKEFDIVLLDSPPILPVADARILAGQADGTIMVVRRQGGRRSDLVDALALLSSSGGKLLGTIFIGDSGRRKYYQYGDYYHYGRKREKE